MRSQLTFRLSGCQNLCHNTDRLYQSAPTGLLAGYRRRSPTALHHSSPPIALMHTAASDRYHNGSP
ncbi:MAG: hypothetical protein HC936_15130 [Leptolyngbyaceae cyanobacterium SU_3_3]|nr:hypothetical protein [Leptolyngbyaceae cyanobacterium SU_3_3]